MIIDIVPPKPLWAPSRAFVEQSNLKKFQNWLFVKKGLYFRDYHDLWDWSVTDLEDFWEGVWQFFEIKSHTTYRDVLVSPNKDFIGTQWFTGSTVNYAEHIFRHKNANHPALLYQTEREPLREISWRELEKQVAAVAAYLRQSGIQPGDRVAAILPNCPQAIVAFLATNSIGAVWSLCQPELDVTSVLDRFKQIEPSVLFVSDSYIKDGKPISRLPAIKQLIDQLPTLKKTVLLPSLIAEAQHPGSDNWSDVLKTPASLLEFTPVPFQHPLWVLYDSTATTKPKVIVHSVGGCLLEHLKTLSLHQNAKVGERHFWYSATNSSIWHISLASMLTGATPVLYEGESEPNSMVLWTIVEKAKVNHLGTDSVYFEAATKDKIDLSGYKFSYLQSIHSIGAILSTEGFEWIYQNFKKDIWVSLLSIEPTICSSFVGSCSSLPIFSDEIQCRLLGCKVEACNEKGNTIRNEWGEMIISEPMPSMPLRFWNDAGNKYYHSRYFEDFADVWHHPSKVKINDRGGVSYKP